MTSPPLIVIAGPTATGKTALAVQLAEHFGGEIINADSRQVYRGMDIGTAKTTAEEQSRVRHHLVDVVDPNEPFSLGTYLDLAHAALADCWSRSVTPFIVGGTGQYVWALLEGWQVPRVPPDPALRTELEARSAESLLEELERVDPAYAARVDRKNMRRVVRALEVYRRTGRPLSACQRREPLDAAWTAIGLTCEREALYQRIDARVEAMMAAGFLDEVRGLTERGSGCEVPSMSGIGYRQLCQHLEGELSLEEAVARIKTETHRLVRMQYTWFRQDDRRIHWVDVKRDPYLEALRRVESELRHE